jgi:hypothetical protein
MVQQWTIPKRYTYVPKKRIETAHPLLILSRTYDPVCPLIAARTATEAYVGSRIVEVEGYGHCSMAVPSACLAKHVRAFLYDGILPEGYTKCEVDCPYFVLPPVNLALDLFNIKARPDEVGCSFCCESRLLDAIDLLLNYSQSAHIPKFRYYLVARTCWIVVTAVPSISDV